MESMKVSPLLTEEQIRIRVAEIARDITRDLSTKVNDDDPTIALILANGALFFAADLLRQVEAPIELQVVRVSSYGAGTQSNGMPEIIGGVSLDKFRGRRVLIVDDVLDTGHTLSKIKKVVRESGAKEVRSCVLLDKPSRRAVEENADYIGFTIDDVFVVGYGLDLNDAWRTLPYVGIVSEK